MTTLTLIVDSDDGRMQWVSSDPFIQSLSRNGLLLPKLQTLRLRQCEPSDTAKLFSLLKAPNIHSIDVSFEGHETDLEHQEFYEDHPDWSTYEDPYFSCPRIEYGDVDIQVVNESFGEALGVFMGRSGSSLHYLRLHYATITEPASSTMLASLNLLTHLVLDEFDLAGDCFKGTRVSSVLPNLRVLELLNLPTEYILENVDGFMGWDEGDQSVTLKATHLDPGLCCPMHSRREPQEATMLHLLSHLRPISTI